MTSEISDMKKVLEEKEKETLVALATQEPYLALAAEDLSLDPRVRMAICYTLGRCYSTGVKLPVPDSIDHVQH